jgi:hypothetical protein
VTGLLQQWQQQTAPAATVSDLRLQGLVRATGGSGGGPTSTSGVQGAVSADVGDVSTAVAGLVVKVRMACSVVLVVKVQNGV